MTSGATLFHPVQVANVTCKESSAKESAESENQCTHRAVGNSSVEGEKGGCGAYPETRGRAIREAGGETGERGAGKKHDLTLEKMEQAPKRQVVLRMLHYTFSP